MKLKTILLFLIILSPLTFFAQLSPIDSLKKAVQKLPNDSNKVNTYLELAKSYGRIDMDTAFVYCDLGLKLGQQSEYYKGVANAYRQIGILNYMKGDNDQSIKNFELSLKTWQEAGDLWGEARAYNNIGIIYKNLGQYDKALESYLKSSEIQVSIKDIEGLAISNNNIANIYLDQGNNGQALEYSFKSLKIHEEQGNEQLIAVTCNNIGNIYSTQEDYEKALEYYQKSLGISEKINDKKGVADIYVNMGDIFTKKGVQVAGNLDKNTIDESYQKAISFYEKSLLIYNEIGYKRGISHSYNSIGEINLRRKEYGNVLNYFKKSLLAFEEMGEIKGIASTNLNIARFYYATKKFNEALKYFNISKKIAEDINSPEIISEVAEGMSNSYAMLGQYQKAYESHVLHTETQKKIKNDETIRNLAKQELSYQVNKKQSEMELEQQRKDLLAQEKIRQQSMYTAGASLALFLMALLAFFIFRGYRIKQKSNVMLAAQKEQILQKNEELKQLNEEISAQREMVEIQRDIAVHKEKEITDSIQYAKRIQKAVLPHRKTIVDLVPDYFIYFKPRDIVSGDFYWMKQLNNHIVIAAADCTGHGVPGAFMSLLGISFLNEIVNDSFVNAGEILNKLRDRIIETLHQTGKDEEAKDGMDISLCVINTKTKKLEFAGAYNPLYLIRNNELIEYKGDKMPIGIHIKGPEPFNNHSIQIIEKDLIYLFSDGYIDQFGGPIGGKFKNKQFKELLLSIKNEPMVVQKEKINKAYEDWKGDLKQLDDILIIGIAF